MRYTINLVRWDRPLFAGGFECETMTTVFRKQRGQAIAEACKLEKRNGVWYVPAQYCYDDRHFHLRLRANS